MQAFENIFSSKAVGLAFAVSFGIWSWMLNNMGDMVFEKIDDARSEYVDVKSQVVDLRAELADLRISCGTEFATVRERQNGVLKRLDTLESHVEKHDGELRQR